MRRRMLWLIGLVGSVLVSVGGCSSAGEEQEMPPGKGERTGAIALDGISLTWAVRKDSLDVTLRAPTTGWVSVGFDPISGMKDANLIIGYVVEGQAVIRDDYGITRTSHEADTTANGQHNVANVSGSETEGATEIGFTIPLDSGDPRDRALIPGNSYSVILGYGKDDADDFTSYHKKRATGKISL